MACSVSSGKFRGREGGALALRGAPGSDLGFAIDLSFSFSSMPAAHAARLPRLPPAPWSPHAVSASRAAAVGRASMSKVFASPWHFKRTKKRAQGGAEIEKK